MITYRQIGFDELEKFERLLVAFCIETNADADALANILNNLESGKTKTFAAENGQICGILGYQMAGESGVVDFFYVTPENRKGFVGGRLCKMAAKYGKEKLGGKKIVAIVTEDKEPLYTKIGFKRKFYLLEKEI
jgi:ribosomal protein S18 acetylase RimI-like enzyme